MSRVQRTAEALNDLQHLFSAEDQEGLIGVALEYFTTQSVSFQDEHSDEESEDESESLYNFPIGKM